LDRRNSRASKVQKRFSQDRRLISAGIGLAVALLLIGVALQAHRGASSGALAAGGTPGAGEPGLPGTTSVDQREQSLLEAAARRLGDARTRERLGTFYVETGRPFEALWELQAARALDPGDLLTGLSLADALAAGRFPDQALAELRALLVRYPGRMGICRRLADLYLATGRPESAAAALRQATELHRSPEALLALGRVSQSLRRYDEAEQALRSAQQLQPASLEPYLHLGRLYLERGEAEAAEQAFLAARVLAPTQAEPRYDLGLSYLHRARSGDEAKAEAELRAAIQLDPEHAGAHRELGRLLLARRRYREAGEQFFQALRAAKDAEAYRGMAQALAAVGRRVESQYHWGLYYTRKDLRPQGHLVLG
jgi:tetratricopeptide (TPR) repeat protein